MPKLKVDECQHCGEEHKALTLKPIPNPIGILKARVTAVATCPKTKLPLLVWGWKRTHEVVWPPNGIPVTE